MSTVTFHLSAGTERKLRDRAEQLGQTLETYLQRLAENVAADGTISASSHPDTNCSKPIAGQSDDFPRFISRPRLTADEMEHLLDEFSGGAPGKVLPPDFSRGDIYDDHD